MIKNKYITIFFLVFSLGIMTIPGVVGLLKFDINIYKNHLQGNSISANVSAFDQYFKNQFFGRSFFYQQNSNIKRSYLRISSKPEKVIVGKNGWLFLGNSDGNVLHESLGYRQFSDAQMAKLQIKLRYYNDWLHERGIKFYFSIAPNKHNLYPEHLPYTASKQLRQKEQLESYLSSRNLPDKIIDLSDQLIPKKQQHRLFMKTDTHWNDLGAFFGSRILLKEMNADFPQIPIWELSDFAQDSIHSFQQDLSDMLSLRIQESNIKLSLIDSCAEKREKRLTNYRPPESQRGKYEKRYSCEERELKLLMFRDSFGSAMIPFLANAFEESLFIWGHFDEELIEREKPDAVVIEVVERYLDNFAN